jgi:hypothetical protein
MEHKIKDGWSESAWKSVAVKSIRIGWPEGLLQAGRRLCPSAMKSILVVQLFEDVFPAVEEIDEVMAEVSELNYKALCRRETHHGRGHTKEFCRLEKEACAEAEKWGPRIDSQAKSLLHVWTPPRLRNVFWTWQKMNVHDAGVKRTIDEAPWRGIPKSFIDVHCHEGRKRGIKDTIVSGHYHRHAGIAEIVDSQGWAGIRGIVHGEASLRVLGALQMMLL